MKQIHRTLLAICALVWAGFAESGGQVRGADMTIERVTWGRHIAKEVFLYTLQNESGVRARITNFGATVVSLEVPDRDGKIDNVVLGYDTLEGFADGDGYFGCIAGRYANRIAKGRFDIGGKTYQLATNNGPNHLHGGTIGFNKKVWKSEEVRRENGVGVKLSLRSIDGEEGYPGNLDVAVTYILTSGNDLEIEYEAVTDGPTVVNLTHHGYFNLAGAGSGEILGHEIMIAADRYTPVDETLIPTGEIAPVEGTPFDFRKPKPIGRDIGADDVQIERGGGYDHNFALRGDSGGVPRLAARVVDPRTGRVMEVHTTEPGLQFYTGNFLPKEGKPGRDGKTYRFRNAFCLEAQLFPDSPNQPGFKSPVLKPGEKYTQKTVYRFSTGR